MRGISGIEEFSYRDIQRRSDSADVDQADVSFAPLDTADVGSIKVTSEGQRLLRESLLSPKLSYASAEPLLNPGLSPPSHPRTMASSWMTIRPRTLRIIEVGPARAEVASMASTLAQAR